MKSDLRNKYLSRVRFNRYLAATGTNLKRAERLYNANIRLSQAFHPLLSQFEVVFRNALNHVLSNHFNDADWIINQKTGFMNHQSLGNRPYLKRCVQDTENELAAKRIPLTSGKIISDQTFGFWVAYFSKPHYRLIAGQPIQAFGNKPTVEKRSSIHRKLEKIKAFRNRINHCEPICFRGYAIDCTEANEVRATLFDLVNWIDPGLVPFFSELDNIPNKINQIMAI